MHIFSRTRTIALACALACNLHGYAQIAPRPVPPSDTTVPVGARLELQVIGQGTQLYGCGVKGGVHAWTFQSPNAKLLDPASHAILGLHGAGPMWVWNDGSALTGTVLRTQASTEAGSVPWLLLRSHPVPGTKAGKLTPIVFVRRSETHGGAMPPPEACNPSNENKTTAVSYSALYTFYSIGSVSPDLH
ncbi:DUF3455 domain-containing protein [Acidipila sp. EB88]|uniref:DUF3455 domain-containing protein n=1 Tax=Acidipila sp. EB88 TaxID=2305226 RepID=UPI000F5F9BEC|nr:DUF3455 domain-containing protein [Acidipila sp. EB88]RRA48833.1 DUF3455 domain-containing protein [Acidipila sp. EB88]